MDGTGGTKMAYIYLTTNLVNGKKYIGQHNGSINDGYLGSGVLLVKAIKKYGRENFKKEILEECDIIEIDKKEKYWIAYYNALEDENFYNLSEGGQQGDGWRAARRYLQQHPEKAEELRQKNIQRLREWEKNNPDKVKENTKRLLQGSRNYFKAHPERRKEIVANLQIAKEKWQSEHPEEHQQQIKKFIKAGSDANSQKVRCINTGEIFPSLSEAARHYNTYQTNISKVLKKERKSAGKHPITGEKLFWEYYIPEE